MNNLPRVVAQQHRGRASNLRLLDRKFDTLPLSHCATPSCCSASAYFSCNIFIDFLHSSTVCVAQLVERRSLTGELSLSCTRPAADG